MSAQGSGRWVPKSWQTRQNQLICGCCEGKWIKKCINFVDVTCTYPLIFTFLQRPFWAAWFHTWCTLWWHFQSCMHQARPCHSFQEQKGFACFHHIDRRKWSLPHLPTTMQHLLWHGRTFYETFAICDSWTAWRSEGHKKVVCCVSYCVMNRSMDRFPINLKTAHYN